MLSGSDHSCMKLTTQPRGCVSLGDAARRTGASVHSASRNGLATGDTVAVAAGFRQPLNAMSAIERHTIDLSGMGILRERCSGLFSIECFLAMKGAFF